jgi:hypothetical protein
MRKIVLCILLSSFFGCFQTFAADYTDVVTMKNGDIYKGVIVETMVNEYVKIELADGSIIRLSYNDIDVISREKLPGYDFGLLSMTFRDKSYGDLLKIQLDQNMILATDSLVRQQVFDIASKKGSFLASLGNIFLPGVGSLIQGDTGWGIYESLSVLLIVGAGISVFSYGYFFYSPVGVPIVALNLGVAYFGGIIAPFVFEGRYNSQLKVKLQL